MRKPNYRFDRSERARSKELKKMEKLEAQAAKRQALRDPSAPIEPDEDHDGSERADEKESD